MFNLNSNRMHSTSVKLFKVFKRNYLPGILSLGTARIFLRIFKRFDSVLPAGQVKQYKFNRAPYF